MTTAPTSPLPVEASTANYFHRTDQQSSLLGLYLTGKLLELLAIFRDSGISVMALKGPALSQLLYNDPVTRQFYDLDLLVHRADVPAAINLLKARGYTLDSVFAGSPDEILIGLNSELSFEGSCGTPVDLHWEIAPKGYPFRFDPEILWSSACSIQIAGRDVPCTKPEALLLYLCVHGAKHLWSSAQWPQDIARLVEITPDMDWDRVFDLAAGTGCVRVVSLGLLLAERLGASVPAAIQERIHAEKVIVPLAEQVSRRLQQSSPTEPTSLEMAIFNAKLATTWQAKLSPFCALLKAPTEEDAQMLLLPPSLFFLYYPFRLFRLIGKYGLHTMRTLIPSPSGR